MFAIVSECCPVGCANDVFLVRSRKDGRLYSYCWACGAMWSHPLSARWDGPDEELIIPRTHSPEGFDLPSDTQIRDAGFTEFVLRTVDDEHCAKYFEKDLHHAI